MKRQENCEKAARSNNIYYVGIDPGGTGAVAIIYNNNISITSFNIEKLESFINALRQISDKKYKLYIEHAHSKKGDGHKGAFTFGRNYGVVLGILATLNIKPTSIIASHKWKREFDLIGKNKQASIDKAKELYPEVIFRRTKRCTTDDHNMAEALLIADYCQRKETSYV